VADDGKFETSAEKELLLVDNALVASDNGARLSLIVREVGIRVGKIGREAERDPFVGFATGPANVGIERHGPVYGQL
jgi:hypothetical protein